MTDMTRHVFHGSFLCYATFMIFALIAFKYSGVLYMLYVDHLYCKVVNYNDMVLLFYLLYYFIVFFCNESQKRYFDECWSSMDGF